MIIVEGPDGSGKDTLIQRLMTDVPELVLGPRAVNNSLKGPVSNLNTWMLKDYLEWKHEPATRVYNRYPIISEPIYGTIIRGYMQPGFYSIARLLNDYIARESLVIICLPPVSELNKNVSPERDMPGVTELINELWSEYLALAKHWCGPLVTYDYTQDNAYDPILFSTLVHINERNFSHV